MRENASPAVKRALRYLTSGRGVVKFIKLFLKREAFGSLRMAHQIGLLDS